MECYQIRCTAENGSQVRLLGNLLRCICDIVSSLQDSTCPRSLVCGYKKSMAYTAFGRYFQDVTLMQRYFQFGFVSSLSRHVSSHYSPVTFVHWNWCHTEAIHRMTYHIWLEGKRIQPLPLPLKYYLWLWISLSYTYGTVISLDDAQVPGRLMEPDTLCFQLPRNFQPPCSRANSKMHDYHRKTKVLDCLTSKMHQLIMVKKKNKSSYEEQCYLWRSLGGWSHGHWLKRENRPSGRWDSRWMLAVSFSCWNSSSTRAAALWPAVPLTPLAINSHMVIPDGHAPTQGTPLKEITHWQSEQVETCADVEFLRSTRQQDMCAMIVEMKIMYIGWFSPCSLHKSCQGLQLLDVSGICCQLCTKESDIHPDQGNTIKIHTEHCWQQWDQCQSNFKTQRSHSQINTAIYGGQNVWYIINMIEQPWMTASSKETHINASAERSLRTILQPALVISIIHHTRWCFWEFKWMLWWLIIQAVAPVSAGTCWTRG